MAVTCRVMFAALLLQCFQGTSQSKLRYFGTKTPYSHPSNPSPEYPKDCTPVHIEYVSRHGSRYPSKSDRKSTNNLLTKLSKVYSSSSPFQMKNLTIPWKKWRDWDDADSKELSARGMREQYEIAKRLRSNFPGVFDKDYWNKYYKFIIRDKRRTSQSAMAFALGLFENITGSLGKLKFQPVAIKSAGPEEEDKLLSPYDACPRYATDVDENGLDEYKNFIKGPEIKEVIKAVEKRLRINGSISLTVEDVEIIGRLCAFGIMNQDDHSWCALLSEDDLDVLNYAADLENYYQHSFGNELSYKIICVLLGDITKNLEDFSKEKKDARGEFRFASSGTLFSLFTILGAYDNGTVLRANNFEQNRNRTSPSNLVSMSANVAFVLYKCNSTNGKGGNSDHKVQILINEKPAALPCCHRNTTCSLNEFLAYFEETVDGCDFDAMCALPKPKTTTPKPTTPKRTKPKASGPKIYSEKLLMILILMLVFSLSNY